MFDNQSVRKKEWSDSDDAEDPALDSDDNFDFDLDGDVKDKKKKKKKKKESQKEKEEGKKPKIVWWEEYWMRTTF